MKYRSKSLTDGCSTINEIFTETQNLVKQWIYKGENVLDLAAMINQ